MSDEIYLDLKVKVNCVSLFTDSQKVLDFADPAGSGVGIYTPHYWNGADYSAAKVSLNNVTILSAELSSGSYSALAELGNLRAIEETEERISGLNVYLNELKNNNS
tara:strand:- start:2483 stop:2800 length:318 start_codon:yes stop_codon:yes gene_type:complete